MNDQRNSGYANAGYPQYGNPQQHNQMMQPQVSPQQQQQQSQQWPSDPVYGNGTPTYGAQLPANANNNSNNNANANNPPAQGSGGYYQNPPAAQSPYAGGVSARRPAAPMTGASGQGSVTSTTSSGYYANSQSSRPSNPYVSAAGSQPNPYLAGPALGMAKKHDGDLHTSFGVDTSAASRAPVFDLHTPKSNTFQQAAVSLRGAQNFMRGLAAIALVCMVLSVFIMGWSSMYVCFTLSVCIGSFYYSMWMIRWIVRHDANNKEMRKISEAIKEGSEGFLSVQYGTIARFAVVVAIVLFIIYMMRTPDKNLAVSQSTLALLTSISFLLGAFCSALAGYMGVWMSVRVNIRVAIAASKFNYNDALQLSFRGGAVSSMLSASMCILGITLLYLFCHVVFVSYWGLPEEHVPMLLAGYGFGASFVALFMQLGGGIYTKAADVGADLVGKVEQDIPEDDPRNPAVIADLVGDNVGDCAGSMADVFESIAAEIIGTMILGGALAHEAKVEDVQAFVFFPLIVHSFDLIISGVGILAVRSANDREDPLNSMKRGYAISMAIAVVCFFITCRVLLKTEVAPAAWYHFAGCGTVGIINSYLIILITQYYTDYKHTPVLRIAAASQTGHGTNIIQGVSVGMESTALPVLVISVSLLTSYYLGVTSGLPSVAAGVFGTAVATMGMLCTAVFILSMNNFGPIADNAGGVVEMSGEPEEVRAITDRLDAVGNVTKAAAKGYAVGGSALACFVLFQAFMDEIGTFSTGKFDVINVAKMEVVVGGLLGIMMIFLFTGWAIAAVGNTAQQVVWEVRRQFREKPGIMDGLVKPDYGTCVAIVTRAALKQMIRPAILALFAPVAIGFIFRKIGEFTGRYMLGIEVVAAFLIFASLTGLLMAIFLDNSGGAWDNAKKYIEATGKKGSEAHKASVTGDTVGDPFKDTAGPALHVIITTMSTTILVLGPLFIGVAPEAAA